MEKIKWSVNEMPHSSDAQIGLMSRKEVDRARAFHRSFPQYCETPLVSLEKMAEGLGLSGVYIKDESCRFGLNAFKVLGGSYAIGKYIAKKTGKDIAETDYGYLTSESFRKEFGQTVFFTATDGNHGRGVAWAARILGQRAVVFMPKGSKKARFDKIAGEGAEVTIEECNYDECVRMAAKAAAETPGGVVVQDTAWMGYEEIPAWIMQGYGTMAAEADDQMEAMGVRPTHIFVQAGVGSLAGAVQGYFADRFKESAPVVVIMEAQAADCLYQSAEAGDGNPRMVDGELNTIMAGLACGEPNIISWDILRNHSRVFVSCPDWVAARGMRMLAAPKKGDPQVISGESGAVGMGLLAAVMTDPAYDGLRKAIGLDRESRVLLFSTEGDTDKEGFQRIVWEGGI